MSNALRRKAYLIRVLLLRGLLPNALSVSLVSRAN